MWAMWGLLFGFFELNYTTRFTKVLKRVFLLKERSTFDIGCQHELFFCYAKIQYALNKKNCAVLMFQK